MIARAYQKPPKDEIVGLVVVQYQNSVSKSGTLSIGSTMLVQCDVVIQGHLFDQMVEFFWSNCAGCEAVISESGKIQQFLKKFRFRVENKLAHGMVSVVGRAQLPETKELGSSNPACRVQRVLFCMEG